MVDGKKYERKMGNRNVAQMKNNNNTNPFIKKPNKTLQTSETKTQREREREYYKSPKLHCQRKALSHSF